MQKPILIFTAACLVLLPTSVICQAKNLKLSMSSELHTMAADYDKGCQWKAKTVKWIEPKKTPPGYSFQLEVAGFIVNIPAGASRFILSGDGDLFITYPDKSALTFTAKFIPDNIRLSVLNQQENKINYAGLANVLFTKTHCDKPPANKNDALFWNYALTQKLAYFEDAKNVLKTDSGKLTYYLSDNASPPVTSGRAIVTINKSEHNILIISAYRMTFDKFKKIVFNTAPQEN